MVTIYISILTGILEAVKGSVLYIEYLESFTFLHVT